MTEHDLTRTPPARLRRARLTFSVVAFVVPLVLTLIGVVVILAWMPDLPDPVVTHWGATGADGFGPASTYLWILVGIGFALPAFMAAVTLASVGTHWGGTARLMGAFATGLAAFALVLSLGSLGLQRGLDDAADTPDVGGVLVLGFAVLLLGGAAAWAVQPRVSTSAGETIEPQHAVNIAAGERVVWVGTAIMPRGVLIGLGLTVVAVAVLAGFLLVDGSPGGWISLAALVAVGLLVPAAAAFRVRVTPEGFSARSFVGWPGATVPLAEIESARAVDVSPLAEFGGWGWRISVDGRTGIVMRKGPAIEVQRRDRRPLLVTVDGAEEAAALLQTYVSAAANSSSTDQGSASREGSA